MEVLELTEAPEMVLKVVASSEWTLEDASCIREGGREAERWVLVLVFAEGGSQGWVVFQLFFFFWKVRFFFKKNKNIILPRGTHLAAMWHKCGSHVST